MPVEQYITSQLVCADVLEWAKTYDGPPFHAMLCDPPYHLISDTRNGSMRPPGTGPYGRHTISTKGFMGKDWDGGDIAYRPETWAALARHLLPGAFIMAFASSRGWHRLACALEDAGLIIHPSIFGWGFGSGFPKATRIDTQVDAGMGRMGMDIVALKQLLIAAVKASGKTAAQIDAECGFRAMNYCTLPAEGKRYDPWIHVLPSAEKWAVMRVVIGGDTRLDRAFEAAQREVTGKAPWTNSAHCFQVGADHAERVHLDVTAPATPLAQAWEGHRYGLQALKPALEPIIVAQVPYVGRPVDSITATGAGAVWIAGARIGMGTDDQAMLQAKAHKEANGNRIALGTYDGGWRRQADPVPAKRWPANFALCHLPTCQLLGTRQVRNLSGTDTHGSGPAPATVLSAGMNSHTSAHYAAPDGTETVLAWACADGCPVAAFDQQAGERHGAGYACNGKFSAGGDNHVYGENLGGHGDRYGDSGMASRFFHQSDWALDVAEQLAQANPVYYCPKASTTERSQGLAGRNDHPTVKPLALLRWLATLLLPPSAYAPRRLLVPFCGTGSEMLGGVLAGWEAVVGIEQDPRYVEMASQRLAWWTGWKPGTILSTQDAQSRVPASSPGQLSLF